MNSLTTLETRYLRFLAGIIAAAMLISGFALLATRVHAAVGTTPPVISNIMTSPTDTGATVTWSTDQAGTSQVLYGLTSAYNASTTLDNTNVTGHTSFIGGLSPSTLYHFEVITGNASGTLATSSDMTFMTLATATTTGGTGTTTTTGGTGTTTTTVDDDSALQTQITNLQSRVTTLEAEVAALMAGGSGGSTGTTTTNGTATIDANNGFITAGSLIDFGGRNFGHEETVKVTLNGVTVATAHADGGGNFSTGSFLAPSVPGTYTYVFTGQTSGMTASTNITVH